MPASGVIGGLVGGAVPEDDGSRFGCSEAPCDAVAGEGKSSKGALGLPAPTGLPLGGRRVITPSTTAIPSSATAMIGTPMRATRVCSPSHCRTRFTRSITSPAGG
jgi:hypothetical protein